MKLKTIRYCEVLVFGTKISPLGASRLALGKKKFSARGRPGGIGPPSVNLGPPNISESTRARKLKLKSQLDMVKYSR